MKIYENLPMKTLWRALRLLRSVDLLGFLGAPNVQI